MPIRVVLFMFALALAVVFAMFAAVGAGVLAHLRGSHPAASLAAGAVAFGATLTLATLLGGLAHAVLYT
ncbi:hypothetical protein [Virgisporangium aurantiacum]|uniref:Uncharacterized protein n=1 Tax=Virgisporangium aurantiacum TaxID=175570 RepID=A0A8J4E5L9_9ACTN|nr:hypothetical protein [Virgisporangium aurantiacum]GIJ62456.1 hypothetical protein Vau01_099720 [Virgisporangium aurantiacum]